MSLPLIRGDLLTELANHGISVRDQVERRVLEMLSASPDPWLPEQFDSPYELLGRSIENSTDAGKKLLIQVINQMVGNLFLELKARKLTAEESRQLLGAMALSRRQSSLANQTLSRVLFFAKREPVLFWRKVFTAEDIVGTGDSDRLEFIESLWTNLPLKLRRWDKQSKTAKDQSDTNLVAVRWRKRGKHSKSSFSKALRRGDLVKVGMSVNGREHAYSLLRLPTRDYYVFSEEDTLTKMALPSKNLGSVKLRDPSPRTIANAIPNRLYILEKTETERG